MIHRPSAASRSRARLRAAVAAAAAIAVLSGAVEAARKPREAPREDGPKTVAGVVGDAARVEGLLTFHRAPDTLWLELPRALLDAPLGLSVRRVGAAGDFALRGGSVDGAVVRFRLLGSHLALHKDNLDFRARPGSPAALAVEAGFPDSPVFSAPRIDVAGDPAPVLVDASKLFGPDLARVLPERSGFTVAADDGVLVSLKAFPDNVVARVSYRARRKDAAPAAGDGNPFARFLRPGRLPDPRFAEIVVDYHLYRLPDDGFEPRFADERIGGWTREYKDYTDVDAGDVPLRHLLLRWDLRKVDPSAAVSPPVEPIVIWIDRSVPERWRPLVREGATWWNAAFEAIGFEEAVQVRDAPDDATWDPADLRRSMIYWNVSDELVFSGAAGPSLVDPRTGEVLRADVHLNGEFFAFALHRYQVYAWWRAPETGGVAEAVEAWRRARSARLAGARACDRATSFSSQLAFARLVLLGRGVLEPGGAEAERFAREAFLELVAHEVGHALGFPHNWKASLAASWEDVRDGRVTGRPGENAFSSSVMDYDPVYLAPRGVPQGDYFLRGIGPYDVLAVEYVYRPLDGVPPAERAGVLDGIAARAERDPRLLYDGGELGAIDPTSNSDDFGDDPLAFADARLALIHDEILPRLDELVLAEGHDYAGLRRALDAAVFSVAMDYVDVAVRHVGGQITHRRVARGGDARDGGPPPIVPVPAAAQRRALDVLDARVFADGAFALAPDVLARMKADLLFDWNHPGRFASDYDLAGRVAGLYETALSGLLAPARLRRVLDNERRVGEGGDRFTLPELFRRLEASAFGGPPGRLSADRRALQRGLAGHLERLALAPPEGTPAEASQLAVVSLERVLAAVDDALAAGEGLDDYTEAHLRALRASARRTLDASVELPARTPR